MRKTKVGICITTYNDRKHIHETLGSVIGQKTNHDLNIYIVDDGSTDITPVILQKAAAKWDHLHLKLAEHRERGETRKNAIQMAIEGNCEYILFIDSDMKVDSLLVDKCLKEFEDDSISALIIPEIPYSKYNNWMTKVKIFERHIINNVDEKLAKNSIEAARFWLTSEYQRSGGLNSEQVSFEEIQPTLRIIERGGKIKRAVQTHLWHNEGEVTFEGILNKKKYYFSQMNKTLSSEKSGFFKALSRWYFFRPYLYSKKNIINYFKNPHLFLGLLLMYTALTLIAFKTYLQTLLFYNRAKY